MWGAIGRGILKFADKQIKKKAYKVGVKRTSWKNKWDPRSGKKVSQMNANELRNYKRYDFQGKPIKGHKFNKLEAKHFGPSVQPWSSLKHSKLPKYMKG